MRKRTVARKTAAEEKNHSSKHKLKQFSELDPPRRHLRTKEWVKTAIEKKWMVAEDFKKLPTDERHYLKEAKALHAPLFKDTIFNPRSSFVTVIPHGRIWGRNGAVITPDNILLSDISIDFVTGMRADIHPAITSWSPYPVTYSAETITTLAFCASENYFHWLYDVLARMHLLQKSGLSIDKYVMNRLSYLPFHNKSLSMLGISPDQIIDTHEHFHLKAERLVVTSVPVRRGYPKWAYDFLRSNMLKPELCEGFGKEAERVYISRGNISSRKTVNEDEVKKILEPYGFRTYVLQDMSLEDQIRLFHSAKVIVAPHGAGLANLTFCKPRTVLIEIFSANYTPDLYWKLSNYGNIDYYHVIGQGVSHEEMFWIGQENIYVYPDQLKATLRLAGL